MSFLDQYNTTHRAAVKGMVANSRPKDMVTGIVEDAAGIGFGIPVYQGTNDKQVTATPGTPFVGITVRDVTLVHSAAADVDKYVQGENCGILRRGVIWVTAEGVVTKGDRAYATDTGEFTELNTENDLGDDIVFDSSAGDGELVRVELS